MRGWGTMAKSLFLGSLCALGSQITAPPASASASRYNYPIIRTSYHPAQLKLRYATHGITYSRRYAYGGVSCVPFARSDSGIDVAGNAWQWWENAAGVYARGSVPEPGSVFAFRSNGRMRLGHVAVVSRVINPREIEVDQANWWGPGMHGGVARNIPVVDVSEANDWTAVRVGLGESGKFGSVYPTYGFIYNRPDTGVMVAASATPAPQPALNQAPSDLRSPADRGWQAYEEVAEAPPAIHYHRRAVHVASSRIHQVTQAERQH